MAMVNPIMAATFPAPIPIAAVVAPPVNFAGGGPVVVERSGLPPPVPVADGARVREELNALKGARMISVASRELVGAAKSGAASRELVGAAKSGAASVVRSLMEIAGRVAITTAVPRIRVRVTVKVEVEVEVVVGSLGGGGAGSCGRAVARKGRRRMESEREREDFGGRIAAKVSDGLRNECGVDDFSDIADEVKSGDFEDVDAVRSQ